MQITEKSLECGTILHFKQRGSKDIGKVILINKSGNVLRLPQLAAGTVAEILAEFHPRRAHQQVQPRGGFKPAPFPETGTQPTCTAGSFWLARA